jgi:RHH-type proline utilization regulon transcriptional repressor/proline dehydrogenase/delta 1-pyrroline-5-carboxylate dehydrogenase
MPMPTVTSAPPFAAFEAEILRDPTPLRAAITEACRRPETEAVQWLLAQCDNDDAATEQQAQAMAGEMVAAVRAQRTRASGVDALMHEFSLSSEEGVALMCLAEALLRIPDSRTADALIADKISKGDWRKHLGESPSLFVNATTWGLLVTGKLLSQGSEGTLGSALSKLIAKGGEPVIRKGVDLAMRMLGNQFVTGQNIAEALDNGRKQEARGYSYSYDMLGEAALTEQDAEDYYAGYEAAIHAIGRASSGRGIRQGPGISIKLSALHPRYSRSQHARVMDQLLPRIKNLVLLAKRYDIGVNIDAEESERLEISLDLVEALAFDADLAGFDGLGIVVQAYQKRAPFVVDHLIDLAQRSGRKLMLRLVKGAYWDAEVKRAQVDGFDGYPVYTRKIHTDVSFLVCAQKMLQASALIYPQFATHNAHTLARVLAWARRDGVTDFEFQCLHGMGETLYDQVVGKDKLGQRCRIYAPVGSHQTLLAYLVRRLLENGANSSFVNQIVDENISIAALLADPFEATRLHDGTPHPAIPLPHALFGSERTNSAGVDLNNEDVLRALAHSLANLPAKNAQWQAAPLIDAEPVTATQTASISNPAGNPVRNPAQHTDIVGHVVDASAADVETALTAAVTGAMDWQITEPALRAEALMRAADLFEEQYDELIALAVREAGKSLPNAIAEVREAVDFLRYYGAQTRALPDALALGPVCCISPWNFPLAIFTGQISAALAAGNVVLAKPAEQTSLIASLAVRLLHQAGIPRAALQFLPGTGEVVGAALCNDKRIKGVIFTGSTEVAQLINRTLAQRAVDESIEIALIAETGGQNAMIVDSSALPEQVVQDVIWSAFDSAGQRCSALRVLFLQQDIADKTITMLKGAMQQLCIGNPDRLATDIGPVIDAEAQQKLQSHIQKMKGSAISHFELALPPQAEHGTFIAPTLFEIGSLAELEQEVFGPVLHVIRYRRADLQKVIADINASGYGLTLGIHSRIDQTVAAIASSAHVGNIYVNRNMVGAVVGVQPFGGEGKSGTGPKAGGPLYLKRLQRNPVMPLHVEQRAAQAPNALSALEALQTWAHMHGHQRLAEIAGHYMETSLLGTTLQLPGPTGERNTLSFAARGAVLCLAATTAALLNQIAAAVATGNKALVAEAAIALIPSGLPAAVKDNIVFVSEMASCAVPFQLALVEGPQAATIKPVLAARQGPLVSTIDTTEGDNIPLWRLVAERSLSVNTTAAGGNASLMMLSDSGSTSGGEVLA